VTEATEEYFGDQDVVGQWLDECTGDGGPHAFTAHGHLFASWRNWCVDRNLRPGSGQGLTEALVGRGFVRKRAHGGKRGFGCLVLKTEKPNPEQFG
jgi:putative DNA primase/helicase